MVPFTMWLWMLRILINVIKGHSTYCKRFHLVPRCSIRVLNSSLETIKMNLTAHINNEEKNYRLQQYLPLAEGIRICYQRVKGHSYTFSWLKRYYSLENLLNLTLLPISIILELLLLMVYLTWKKIRKVPEKKLDCILYCFDNG